MSSIRVITLMIALGLQPFAASLWGQSTNGAPAATGAACPQSKTDATVDSPTLSPVDEPDAKGLVSVSGKLSKAETGTVQLCVEGKTVGTASINNADSFAVSDLKDLKAGQKIQAQFVDSANNAGKPTDLTTIGDCSKLVPAQSSSVQAPTLSLVLGANDTVTYSGTAKGAKDGDKIRICVDNVSNGKTAAVKSEKFDGGTESFTVASGQKVVAQQVISGTPASYGPLSDPVSIVAQLASQDNPNKAVAVLIGGVEYSGYSAQSQTTNGFLDLYYQGPSSHHFAGWTRIRLTSTPQQATNGVVSVISNPTGLTTYDYSNVGQAIDYVFGPTWTFMRGKSGGTWAAIAEVGATSPLSSQNAPVTFVAPGPGTNECTELVSRFSPAAGYNPGLSLNTTPNPTTCLAGGYTDIAFSNEDRSSFFLKYGGGFRAVYPWKSGQCSSSSDSKCSIAYAAVDGTIGQDASVTGGSLHRLVFKLDGILPIPTGSASWLYLFGSSYIRLEKNQNLPPLILTTPTATVTVPSPTVFVLPLRQPNRDYYRLGVGLNINQLWCKAFGTGCSTGTQTTGGGSSSGGTSPTTPTSSTSQKKKSS
ncbi:MAG TPA: hypothetical protein VMG31_07925 [Verrucomicrobiae bacterium]|nr:hypothetical protein [Verrucomicrobiae bacterium]